MEDYQTVLYCNNLVTIKSIVVTVAKFACKKFRSRIVKSRFSSGN